jgi:phosphosulfolactate phosphohydrolase-like enzyme
MLFFIVMIASQKVVATSTCNRRAVLQAMYDKRKAYLIATASIEPHHDR